jgi:hypothetical protein
VLSLFLKRNYSEQLEEEEHEIFSRGRRAIRNSVLLILEPKFSFGALKAYCQLFDFQTDIFSCSI